MFLYTYADADGNVVDEAYATTSLDQARDHAARYRRVLMENTYEFTDSEMIEDYTAEDESDG